MSHSFIQNSLDNWKFHIIKDERLVSKMEGKTIFSRRLKQFDGLTWLTLTPASPPPYFTADLRQTTGVTHYCVRPEVLLKSISRSREQTLSAQMRRSVCQLN